MIMNWNNKLHLLKATAWLMLNFLKIVYSRKFNSAMKMSVFASRHFAFRLEINIVFCSYSVKWQRQHNTHDSIYKQPDSRLWTQEISRSNIIL